MKAKLATLEKDASREDTRKAVEEFKKDNEARFAAVKEAADKVHEELKAKRPERKERTEPPPSVKVKIAEVKKVEKTLHCCQKGSDRQIERGPRRTSCQDRRGKGKPRQE